MAATVKETIRELLLSMVNTIEALGEFEDDELERPSDHVCAQGGDVMKLITNDIDHELTHAGHIFDARYEAKIPRQPISRFLAEWLEVRARFVGSLMGLTDEQFLEPMEQGEWSYRQASEHVLLLEVDSLRSIREGAATTPAR